MALEKHPIRIDWARWIHAFICFAVDIARMTTGQTFSSYAIYTRNIISSLQPFVISVKGYVGSTIGNGG